MATLWVKQEVQSSFIVPFSFWKAVQIVPSRVEAKLLMSRSQDLSPWFAKWGRKKTVCTQLPSASSVWAQEAGRRGNKSEKRDGAYLLTKSQCSALSSSSQMWPLHLWDRQSLLWDDTLIIVLLPGGTHTCKPLCKNIISFSLRILKIIRHGFFDARKSGQKRKQTVSSICNRIPTCICGNTVKVPSNVVWHFMLHRFSIFPIL